MPSVRSCGSFKKEELEPAVSDFSIFSVFLFSVKKSIRINRINPLSRVETSVSQALERL